MKPTLVILAAGMASRYGSMKQVQGFGPNGETIMDYSIYDAIRAGFGKIVFIIRREFAEDFKNIFEPKLRGRVETAYVYQEMDSYLGDFEVPVERKKPWGTAHAVLCADDAVSEPFAVINADDFYGTDAFVKAFDFLTRECLPSLYAIIGYDLNNTLSEHGSVSRGVCEVDEEGYLTDINERTQIYREEGKIIYEENGKKTELPLNSRVSMNFWCFHPSVFGLGQKMFQEFLKENINNPKAEFFIPIVGDKFITQGHGKIRVIPTDAPWFGVTYKEDAPGVEKSIRNLITNGIYPGSLWN
jgi:NDP-sugar pyrophosphorylase family protein